MSNILNIPSNYYFLASLAKWLRAEFPRDLSEVTILLPSKRACRELKSILPKARIAAISDFSSRYKVLSGIDQILFLADQVQKQSVFGENNFEQAFKIAVKLRDLFEDLERERVDLTRFYEIDDSNLSQHRLVTLDFIKSFYAKIKNSLIKEGIYFSAAAQNLAISDFVNSLNFDQKIVVAGSTGSIPAGRDLIKKISLMPNGYVVLQDVWSGEFEAENHPQYLVGNLKKIIGKGVVDLTFDEFKISDQSRKNLLCELMVESEKSSEWIAKKIDFDAENIRLFELKNEIEEAEVVAEILSKETRNSALIVNNKNIAKLVKLRLRSASIPFNDSRALDVFDSPLINFLTLIVALKSNNFDSYDLLALLKSPFCEFSKAPEIIAEFEIKILRQDRICQGLEGINRKLAAHPELKSFFDDFFSRLDISIVKTAENLSAKTWSELLESEPAKKEIGDFFDGIERRGFQPKSTEEFKMMLSQICYFDEFDADAKIQILSRIEARLLNFDLVVISSMNEGDFPEIESDGWLGKKIKKDLGIENSQKKAGQCAFDFCNYLGNKNIVLTRSKTRSGAILLESPFLSKFKLLAGNSGAKIEQNFSKKDSLNFALPIQESPNPPVSARPQSFSLTEISKLISDPYSIYAKKILNLRKLDEIDYEPNYREFGSFVHKALEMESSYFEIFKSFFKSSDAEIIWWPKFEKLIGEFEKNNRDFSAFKSENEKAIKLEIGGVLIFGRIDRVLFRSESEVEIFDYKTGEVPTKKSVFALEEPQLILAAMAMSDKFKINALKYWKASIGDNKAITSVSEDSQEIEELMSATKIMLEEIFAKYRDQEKAYEVTEKTMEGDYFGLVRVF